MAGKGKYTQYVPAETTKSLFLQKLFPGGGGKNPPFYGKKQDEAAQECADFGNQFIFGLKPDGSSLGRLSGDDGFFPAGFYPDYSGEASENGIQIPNKFKESWQQSGDAANPYTPDITSPAGGPGDVTPYGKSNPQIGIGQIKPNYPLTTSDNTKNPNITAPRIHKASLLGKDSTAVLGQSYNREAYGDKPKPPTT